MDDAPEGADGRPFQFKQLDVRKERDQFVDAVDAVLILRILDPDQSGVRNVLMAGNGSVRIDLDSTSHVLQRVGMVPEIRRQAGREGIDAARRAFRFRIRKRLFTPL